MSLCQGSVPGLADGSGARLLAPGSTVYTCMLNKHGGGESDLTVSRISPGDPASPLAPAFEGKSPQRGDAGGGWVSAAAVGLGGIAGWVHPPTVELPSSPAAFFSCVNARKDLSQSREAVTAASIQSLPASPPSLPGSGAAGVGVIAFT